MKKSKIRQKIAKTYMKNYSVDGRGTVRPDIVLFVNGIPFAVIECKKASISMEQGISQMIRNQKNDYVPQLFKFVQMVMATNKNETKYATCGTPKKFKKQGSFFLECIYF